MTEASPIIAIDALHVTYNHAIVALAGASLKVWPGEIVAVLGANGAGKSTTLRAVSNLLPPQRGRVTSGKILFEGRDITHLPAYRIVRRGLVQVLEGRHCFRSLTIEENLWTGAAAVGTGSRDARHDLDRVYDIFPALRDKRRLPAGLASGGEQQMTAIGRALMSRPRMLVLDEPSMGLAPRIVEEVFRALQRLNAGTGLSILVAEQNSNVALRYAGRAYVLEHGEVVLEGAAETLRQRDDIKTFYLGLADRRHPTGAVAEAV
ncbi:MAG: ABC transporter ATP-binding protein [Rhodospirillales bacterium]